MPSQIPDALASAAVGTRVYSGSPEHLEKATKPQVAAMVEALRNKVAKVFLAVWEDAEQPHSDFGGTYDALVSEYAGDPFVEVLRASGDLFVSAINRLAKAAHAEGFEYFLTLSASAHHLLTPQTIHGINMAFAAGEFMVVVTSPDNPITYLGAGSHTCLGYYLPAFIAIGGTDVRDTRPADFTPETSDTGVQEYWNAERMRLQYGRPVMRVVVSNAEAGDARMNPEHPEHATHMAKLALKKDRAQRAFEANGYPGESGWNMLLAAQAGPPILAETIRL